MPDTDDERLKKHREELEYIERCYSRVFNSDDGQVVFKDLQRIGFLEKSTYEPGCTDAMLINEGCRRVMLRIIKMTRMDVTTMYLEKNVPSGKKKRVPNVEIENKKG